MRRRRFRPYRQAFVSRNKAMAPEKATEAVWLGLVGNGLSTLPTVGSASHLSPGLVDKTDYLMMKDGTVHE